MQNKYSRESIDARHRPIIRTVVDGKPVYEFGYASIPSFPPELTDAEMIQKSNFSPKRPLELKASWEISDNYVGVCTTGTPCLPENDYNPQRELNLIDGNSQTCWCSYPHRRSNQEPVWIRIDLAREQEICRIALKKRPIEFDRSAYKGSFLPSEGAKEIGCSMAHTLCIKASRDALNWNILFDGPTGPDRDDYEFSFPSAVYKQIMIIGNDLDACEIWGYMFSIACVEVYNARGVNIALLSKGTGITASSFLQFAANGLEITPELLPAQLDLGVKWSRIGYHDGRNNWHWVEKEKGKLELDSECRSAVNMLIDNGVNVVYCLNFGNRFYEGYPERRLPQLPEWYYETPFPPTHEKSLEAWERFVTYSVKQFGSRVRCYEIWNEWCGGYWGDTVNTDDYIRLALRTIPIIRRYAPESLIMLGSPDQDNSPNGKLPYLYQAIDALAPYVDAIGFHPFYQPDPESSEWLDYDKNFLIFKKYCEAHGFRGNVYMASEYGVGANYPPTFKNQPCCWWCGKGGLNFSEIQKAKLVAQFILLNSSLGIQTEYCETSGPAYLLELSLFRKGFDSTPIQKMDPNPTYFTMRNICTAIDGFTPADITYETDADATSVKICAMGKPNEVCLALWLSGKVSDNSPEVEISLSVEWEAKNVYAVQTLNGVSQTLVFNSGNNKTQIEQLIIRDEPLLVFISR